MIDAYKRMNIDSRKNHDRLAFRENILLDIKSVCNGDRRIHKPGGGAYELNPVMWTFVCLLILYIDFRS